MPETVISHSAIIPIECSGKRLDHALQQLFPDYSRARLQQWLKNQHILLDGHPARAKDKVQGGECIVIAAPLEVESHWGQEVMVLDIVYEDEWLLVVNKPAGIVTHPGAGNAQHTLVNGLLHHAPQLQHVPRSGIVHRLDKDTSGLLVVAKTLAAHTYLVDAIQKKQVHREYDAIVVGVLTGGGTIDAPLGRHPTQRTKRAVVRSGGKAARTHYRVQERFQTHTWLRVILETGRTHQIRVHMAHQHHPLIGDKQYGRNPLVKGLNPELQAVLRNFPRQALHARRLHLLHPETGATLEFEAPLPEDLERLLRALRGE